MAWLCSHCSRSNHAHQEVQADMSCLGWSLELEVQGGVGRDLWAVWMEPAPLRVQSSALLGGTGLWSPLWGCASTPSSVMGCFGCLVLQPGSSSSKTVCVCGIYTFSPFLCALFPENRHLWLYSTVLLESCHFHPLSLNWENTATGVTEFIRFTWEISDVLGRRRESVCVSWYRANLSPQERFPLIITQFKSGL